MTTNEAIAFAGEELLAAGSRAEVAVAVKARTEADPHARVLIFGSDGRQVDFDLRGSTAEVAARLERPAKVRGRPKLGVTGREVTLMPRHWDWLQRQPGGASVALRRLVEEAMRSPAQEARAAQEAAYRFMSVMAGDLPGFEEAARALFARDENKFSEIARKWPRDIADHAAKLAEPSFRSGPA